MVSGCNGIATSAGIALGEELARLQRLIDSERQHLTRPGSRAVDRHALEAEPPALAIEPSGRMSHSVPARPVT
jgi:hypothetical protein